MRSSNAADRLPATTARFASARGGSGLLILALFLSLVAAPLFAQSRDTEPSGERGEAQLDIVLLPIRVADDEPRLEAVARTVEETLALAFRLLPGYTVATPEASVSSHPAADQREDPGVADGDAESAGDRAAADGDAAPDAPEDTALEAEAAEKPAPDPVDLQAAAEGEMEALRRVARAYGVEVVIYGEARRGDGGELFIALNAYDYFDDVVAIRRREATDSVFQVFEMADDIALAFMEAFEEVPLAFGSLRLLPEGARGDYTVFLNDQAIGTNARTVDRLLTGRYALRVEMERRLETLTLVERRVAIGEGDRVSVTFEIPTITEAERERIAEYREGAWERYHRGLTTRTASRVEDALRIAEALPASDLREELLRELDVEIADLTARVAAAQATDEFLASLRPRPGGEEIPPPAGAYVGRMSDYLDGDAWVSSYTPYVAPRSIRIDGNGDDWAFFPSIAGSGSHWGSPPVKMAGVAAARDGEYLYLLARPAGALPRNLGYQFQVMDIQDRRGRDIGSTVIGVEPENGRFREYFAKNYWNQSGRWNELSGASIAVGRVVEARVPIGVIAKETPTVNMHVYRPDWSANGGTHNVPVNLSEYAAVHPAERQLAEAREAADRSRSDGADGGEARPRGGTPAVTEVAGSEFFQEARFDPGWSLSLMGGGTLGTDPSSWNVVAGLSADVAPWLALGVAGGVNVSSRERDGAVWTDGLAFGSVTLGRLHRGLALHLLAGVVISDEEVNLGFAPGLLIRSLYVSLVPLTLFDSDGVVLEVGYSWRL